MTKSIRALERGLTVIEALGRRKVTSLAALARATDLPKPTLLRVLKTLIEKGWAYRRVNDGTYCLALAPGGRDPAAIRRTKIARIGAAFLQKLSEGTGLPADLTIVVEPGILEVVESTRVRCEGGVDPIVAGFRPSLVFSAPGRMLLAAASEPARQEHLAHILRTDSPAERFFVTSGALAMEIERSLKRGYARRESGYWPSVSDYGEEPMDIAVPLGKAGAPLGCLSLVWPAATEGPEAVASAHLAGLDEVAGSLSKALARESV
jgi:IclR family mhp operon transcriptional activator